jgi:hypothetical protein
VLTRRRALVRGGLVARLLAGSWRPAPSTPVLSASELRDIARLVMRTGAGALGWWRIRGSRLATTASALELQQAYRLQTLDACLHDRRITTAVGILRAAGIEPILAKGWAAARLYPEAGLRPYGDVDLWVPPPQRHLARAALGTRAGHRCRVDLHHDFAQLGRRYEDVHERSRVERLGAIEVRVLGAEDHLALLCLHMLGHGAWRPVWLCDIAAAVESLPPGFDWGRCFPDEPRRARWVACALGLARELLGAEVSARYAVPTPRWLAAAVLRQWARDEHYMSTPSMAFVLRHPRLLPKAVRLRWPNAVQATVELGGPFNDLPRLPFQVGDCVWRVLRAAGATHAAARADA